MLCTRRRQPAVTIGRRRSDAATERRQELLCHGVLRNPDSDSVLTAGDDVVNVSRALHHHREGSWPEPLRKLRGDIRHVPHPTVQETRAVQMHDNRMGLRTALGLEDLAHRSRVLRICAEPVDRFRRKRDQLAVTQRLYGGLDLDLCGPDYFHHGARILPVGGTGPLGRIFIAIKAR